MNENILEVEIEDVNETYTEKELEDMKDDLEFNEVQEIIKSNVVELPKTQTRREVPPWLNQDLPEEEREKLKKDYIYDHLDIKNPYRKDSSVNLSKEIKNFRRIETNVLLNLIKSNLNGSEFRVLFYVIHRTRGFEKHVVKISIKDIQEYTDISKPNIYKTVTSLLNKHILYGKKEDNFYHLGFNFRYDTWEVN